MNQNGAVPAFPNPSGNGNAAPGSAAAGAPSAPGLSKREHIAALMMHAEISKSGLWASASPAFQAKCMSDYAQASVAAADALLSALGGS